MATLRRPAALAFLAVVLLAIPASANASDPVGDLADRIVFSGPVLVARGTQAGEVVVVRGSALVEGVVLGDVIVLSGPVDIRGQVSGDVIAIDGNVSLGANAQVRGDVLARGTISIRRGAQVEGSIRRQTAFTWRAPVDLVGPFAPWLAMSISSLLLGLLLVLVAPGGLDAVAAAGRGSPWLAVAWSAALVVGLPVAIVLALASLVALPLGLVVLLGLGLLAFGGYALTAYGIGRALWAEPRSRAVAFLFGWLVLRALAAIPYMGAVTFVLAGVLGIGAAIVATWRVRAAGGKHRERRPAVRWSETIREEAGL